MKAFQFIAVATIVASPALASAQSLVLTAQQRIGGAENSYTAEARSAPGDSGFFAGIGAQLDEQGAVTPSLRLGWMQPEAAYPFMASLVSEFPHGAGRDPADLFLVLGQRLPCSARLECALEFNGEDLEGLFEPEEAEGGARVILGPSLGWRAGAERKVRLFAGWLHAVTNNTPTRAGYASEPRDGAMLRLALEFGE